MKGHTDLGLEPAEAVALLEECVRADTVNPPGNEERMTAALARWLERAGLAVEVQRLSAGRANLLARLGGKAGAPALVFSGHTDTVPTGDAPWTHHPWGAERSGDRLYGRGACDMKSGLAAMVMAIILLRRSRASLPGDLVLAASAGEEVDCLGARAFVEAGALRDAGAVIVGEPTGGEVGIAHKGALWVRLTTTGRVAHGSMPEQGVNALLRMDTAMDAVLGLILPKEPHPLLGRATLSVNTIRAGGSVNVVPDRCDLGIDIRTVSAGGHAEIEQQLRAAVGSLDFPVEIDVLSTRPPVETDPRMPLVARAVDAASRQGAPRRAPIGLAYFTDASVYQSALGAPVIIFGPGEAAVCHQRDEWVSVAAYLDAIRFYATLAQTWRGGID